MTWKDKTRKDKAWKDNEREVKERKGDSNTPS